MLKIEQLNNNEFEQNLTKANNFDRRLNNPSPANPSGIFGQDNRQRVGDTLKFPFSAVARIVTYWSNGEVTIGSGTLISPYHILTAGHIINDSSEGGWAQRVEVFLGSKGTITDDNRANFEYYGVANSVNFRADGNWVSQRNYEYDFGLITLDRNIGNYTRWFNYNYNNNIANGTQVNVAGYPGDFFDSDRNGVRDNYDMVYQVGAITGTTELELNSSDLDIYPGNSGGPLWINEGNNATIYGVVSSITYNTFTRVGLYNNFTRITQDRYNQINNWINEDNAARQPIDKPDLVDYDQWFDTNTAYISSIEVASGNYFAVSTTIRNNGTVTSSPVNISFYASIDQVITDSDYKIGDRIISSIAPFNFKNVVWTGSFPDIPKRDYYVGWIADSTNVSQEFDESNNTGIFDNSILQVKSSATVVPPSIGSPTPISSQSTDPLLQAPVYRFFNTKAGGHFFTASIVERDNVIRNLHQYVYEGVGFNASTIRDDNLLPVYRFFNTVAAGHFFTINETERNLVQQTLPQYIYEGIGFYAYGVASNLGKDIYRFFNTVAGGHFFTINETERDLVINSLPQYIYEGTGFEAAS